MKWYIKKDNVFLYYDNKNFENYTSSLIHSFMHSGISTTKKKKLSYDVVTLQTLVKGDQKLSPTTPHANADA